MAANGGNGVLLVDVADPYVAAPIGAPIDAAVNWSPALHGVAVRGPYAFLADNGGDDMLKIVRIAD